MVLVLRTCKADLTSFKGFQWPESGHVSCDDWDPIPECGHGLHGLLWGQGNGSLLDWSPEAKWLVVEVLKDEIVKIDNWKVKFPKGNVIFCGSRQEAARMIYDRAPCGTVVVGAEIEVGDGESVIVGYRGTALTGPYGTAMAGDEGTAQAGYKGTAQAGDRGTAVAGDGGTAQAGDRGTAVAGDEGTAQAGNHGVAQAGNYGVARAGSYGKAVSGYFGTAQAGNGGTAQAGNGGTAQAGHGGKILIDWHDGSRYRLAVGYVGEEGIEADVPYKVDPDTGKFVLAALDGVDTKESKKEDSNG